MSTIELAVKRLAVVSPPDSVAEATAAIKRVAGFRPRVAAVHTPAALEPLPELRGIATPAWAGPVKLQSVSEDRSIVIAAFAAIAGAALMWGAISLQGKAGAQGAAGERTSLSVAPVLAGVAIDKAPAATLVQEAPQPAAAGKATIATSLAVAAPGTAPVPAGGAAISQSEATISEWARAWSARDAGRYLGFYSAGFLPDHGISRSAWENKRRQRLQAPRSITVAIRDLRLEPLGENRMIARFAQDYAADSYRETGTRKMLLLVREAAGWRIAAETVDAAPSTAG